MTIQISDAVANAMLEAWETAVFASGGQATLRLRSGAPPANLAAASTGTVIASMTLPVDAMAAAAARAKAKSGTWEDLSADNAGTVGHYEIITGGGARAEQGTVTATGGGGDMTIDNTVVAQGQAITVTAFNRSMPNNA